MKLRILGCGTSTGVPKIGNHWGDCDPAEPRNRRLRTSLLVTSADQRFLVDCGPDLREQLLAADVERLDGVIITHTHGDHCHGLDELRPVAAAIGQPVPVYARAGDLEDLKVRFGYAFAGSEFYSPIVRGEQLGRNLQWGTAVATFADQPHGNGTSLGIRFDEGDFSAGYAIDFSSMTDDMIALYEDVDVWFGDCLTRTPHPTHMHLAGLLAAARDLRVGQLYLVHMGNGLDYRTLMDELPDWAAPAYDGLEFSS